MEKEIQIDGLGALAFTDDELDGILGNEIGRAAKQAVKKAANNKLAAATQNSIMSREQKFLALMSPKFSAESRDLMEKGRLAYGDSNHYVRAKITGGGIINLFDNVTNKDKAAGITSFEKQKLGTGVNASIGRLELMYAAMTPNQQSPENTVLDASYAPLGADVDVALMNAEIEVLKNGISCFKGQVNQFVEKQAPNDGYANGINLKKNILILAEDIVQIQIHVPAGKTLSQSYDHFVEVKLRGSETQLKQG